MDIGQVESDYDGTDLEIIEWPGMARDLTTHKVINPVVKQVALLALVSCPVFWFFLPVGIISDKKEGDKTTGVSYQDNLQKKLHETFIPMSYEGDVSSFKNYDCNRRLGTHIRAMGFRPNVIFLINYCIHMALFGRVDQLSII